MRSYRLLIVLALSLHCHKIHAQDKRWIKHQIATLCGPQMQGRGYYKNGRQKAGQYIAREFQKYGLRPMGADSSYTQAYTFPVNTFPGDVALKIGKKDMQPSADYLVDAASSAASGDGVKITTIDFGKRKTYEKIDTLPDVFKLAAKQDRVYLLNNLDTICKKLELSPREFRKTLIKGTYIIPQHSKLMWTIATDTMAATIFQVADTSLPKHLKKATYVVTQKLERAAKSENILGFVPGTAVPDSFILFTAHYDHLGHMGHEAEFPGASDNASGTAMMLYLASYFAQHPQRYSIGFIAFSGEEAGLKGSDFYTQHPTIDLTHIRFLTNLDIMGDATDGITVVNATDLPREFGMLQKINDKQQYLPQVKSRGATSNSDHYHFTERGVPAFFIYTNGGPGFYHDVFDKPATLPLTNIEALARLLQDFVAALQ